MTDQVKIYNPWNPNNKDIPMSEIIRIAKYAPKRVELFKQACVHKSFVARDTHDGQPMAAKPADCMPLKTADNEHLEFVGDGILDAIVGEYLERRYPGEGEGFWTSLRSDLVNNEHLGELAIKMGMGPWLIMSRHMEEVCGGRTNRRMLGSMLEAWIAAMFRDRAGDDIRTAFWHVQQWFTEVLETYVDFAAFIATNTNYKDQLLRYFQATYHQPPRYTEVGTEGPLHNRIFTMGVLLPDGTVITKATARNKKDAEQEASRLALIELGQIQ
jgi:ribonuclease III|uniref:RNase III domain-containing protein n=1 Tax=viral metagenome TaxID=1070528 RepID=A0A6C0DB53_9ZZZZ